MATSTPPGNPTNLGMAPNVAALLCYVPCCIGLVLFSIVAAIVEKQSRFVRFHAFQSLLLNGAGLAVWFGLWVLSMILGALAGPLGLLLMGLAWLVMLGALRRHRLPDDQGERRRGVRAAGDRADGPSLGLDPTGRPSHAGVDPLAHARGGACVSSDWGALTAALPTAGTRLCVAGLFDQDATGAFQPQQTAPSRPRRSTTS